MNNYYPKYYSFIILLGVFLSSCGVHKHAQKPLLSQNKIIVHGEKYDLEKDEVKTLLTQSPNKNFLGIWRFKLHAHQLPEKKGESNFRNWMRNTFGEPPVFYEPQIVENTKSQIETYLNNSGYFNSKVWVEQKFKKRKFYQYYHIELAKPYLINDISYHIRDTIISRLHKEIHPEGLVKRGDIYNAFTLDNERDRITTHLKNNGYYNFSKEYIYYEVDSSLNNRTLNISLRIKNVEEIDLQNQAQIIERNHNQFKINKVVINPEFDLLSTTNKELDTLMVNAYRDTSKRVPQTYHFLHDGKPRIKPKVITQAILVKPHDYFSLENVKSTYRNLADLNSFKYTNINFRDISDSTNSLLDCYIDLSRSKTHSYSIEAEGTNSGGDLGIGANLIYRNKNIFKGAEIFEIKLSTSMEAQQLNAEFETAGNKFLFFNTIETGIETSLTFPKFLIPIKPETFPQNFKPHTILNAGLNFQQRPNYKRYITNISFGYEWIQNERTRHILNPIEFNSVKVFPTAAFADTLNNLTNERIKNQYTDHLIVGLKYSFIYNTQQINKLKDFVYLRGNFESSGFLLKGLQTLFRAQETDGYNTLFNIRYAQYIRGDIDFRYYKILNANTRLVFRTFLGIGYPYGNTQDLPFEKGFFAGGANGMRGWNVRSLGPGSSQPDDNIIDRIGDMRLELNLEYRFPIYRFLRGGLFVDTGNVWRINNDVIPGSAFEFNDFLSEIAMDAGMGFRFDFRFFVFRIDGAIRLRDPSRPKSDRWIINQTKLNKIVWNFGIGYPF